ncbi:MAG: alpha/beta fold hydrolase [Planctomycetes bacterium]|nr:alpha/beta fold hydrolase [Planctomycetota bacterium]
MKTGLLTILILSPCIAVISSAASAEDLKSVSTRKEWDRQRKEILVAMERVMGSLPGKEARVALDVQTLQKAQGKDIRRIKLSYQSDKTGRVHAWLLRKTDKADSKRKRPAVLCLHQTVRAGKDEPVGLSGSANMHYALELARRGYVTLSPDYPSLGEHEWDFKAHPEYVSGTMKAIHDNRRAVDLLQSLPDVDPDRIGVIGHSLGGHSAMFTAAFEPRLKVIVSSCGFSSFHRDDVPSWTGPRYMPRIASEFGNDADRLPFAFSDIIATFAPRPFLASASIDDRDFDVTGVRESISAARPVYKLLGEPARLQGIYPDSPHDFPPAARKQAYEFLDQYLKP